MMEPISVPLGKPTQIIEIKVDKGRTRLTLNRKELCSIFGEAEKYPIALISIAGPSRMGKSFLLCYMLRYLNALENGKEENWMGSENEILSGFPFKNCVERITTGFWVWSHPFIIKRAGGQKVAVILMDTQGVFDEYTTEATWSTIVALCALTSSCLIYNLTNNLQEDALQALQTFVEYSLLAKNDGIGDGSTQFDRLMFLIRDWNNADTFDYGEVGGTNFIQERFKDKIHLPQSSKDMREALQKSFRNIDCFLMPKPDDKVLSSRFTGSVAEIDPKFKKNLQHFIETVLSPENIFPKSFNGKNITAKELGYLFEKYTKVFNENQLITPMSLFEATAEANNQTVIDDLENLYLTQLREGCGGTDFASAENLESLHNGIKANVIETFEERRKLGDKKMKELYKKKLNVGIDTLYKKYFGENEKRGNAVKANLVEKAVKLFTEQLEKFTNGQFIPEEDLATSISALRKQTRAFLEENCRDDHVFQPCYAETFNYLENVEKSYINENTRRKGELKDFYEETIEKLLQEYQTNMESYLILNEKNFIEDNKLLQMSEFYAKRSLDSFAKQGRPELSALGFYDDYRKILEENIKKISLPIAQQNKNKENEFLKQVEKTMQSSIMKYNTELTNLISEAKLDSVATTSKFELPHFRSKSAAISFFEGQCKIDNVQLLLQFKNTLSQKLEEEFQLRKRDMEETASAVKMNALSQLQHAEKKYLQSMDEFMETQKYIPNAEIKIHHGKIKISQLDSVKECEAFKLCPLENELSSLETNMEHTLQRILSENEEKLQSAHTQVQDSYFANLKCSKNQMASASLRKLSEEEWPRKANQIKTVNYEKFIAQTSAFSTLEGYSVIAQKLNNEMDDCIHHHTEQIIAQVEQNEKLLISKVSSLVDEYKLKIGALPTTASLTQHHEFYKQKALSTLNQLLDNHISNNKDEMILTLADNIEKEYRQIVEGRNLLAQEIVNSRREECNSLLEGAKIEMYAVPTTGITPEKLQRAYLQVIEACIAKYQEISNNLIDLQNDRSELMLLAEKLLEEHKTTLSHLGKEKLVILEKLEEIYNNLLEESLKGCQFLEPGDVDKLHTELEQKTKAKLSHNMPTDKNMLDDLQNLFNKRFSEFKKGLHFSQKEKKIAIKNETNRHLSTLVSEYQKTMESVASDMSTLEELKKKNDHIQNEIKSSFWSSCPFSGEEKSSYASTLSKKLGDAYTDLELAFETKIKFGVLKSESMVDDCKTYYKQEMDKYLDGRLYVSPSDISKWHRTIKTSALSKFVDKKSGGNSSKLQLENIIELELKLVIEINTKNIPKNPAIGIDLGTTFCCVAVYHNGKMEVIPNEQNKLTTPSYVAFNSKGEELVGNRAKDQAHENPQNTIFDAKRLIGRRCDDPLLQQDIKLLPYTIVQQGGIPKIQVNDKTLHPEEISGKLLRKLKEDAEKFLGCKVTNAVITVPAYFNDGQRQATKDAGEIAGLKVLRIINEPSAAAFAYSLEQVKTEKQRHALVFDFGGGTFDIAILRIVGNAIDTLSVLGDTHLGGEDFDSNLVDYCIKQFQQQTKFNLLEDRESEDVRKKYATMRKLRRLRNECEKQKINLSSGSVATVSLAVIHENTDLDVELTRETFEDINASLFTKSIDLVSQALKEAQLDKKDIDDIILVGGSTRIPKIQQLLTDFFKGKQLNRSINPDEAVAKGAAIQAAILNGNTAVLNSGTNNAVALKITDVTPYSYGIEVFEGDLSVIIPKNTSVPTSKTQTYLTAYNNQTSVLIVIYDGEEKKAVDNHKVGEFYLNGIPSAKAGQQRIKVTMSIDDESILKVTASCILSGSKTELTVREHKGRMSSKEISALAAK